MFYLENKQIRHSLDYFILKYFKKINYLQNEKHYYEYVFWHFQMLNINKV